jgi:glyoxalase family protein
MQLEGIHHISLITADADAALRFYGDLLGLVPLGETRGAGRRIALGDEAGTPGRVLILDERRGIAPGRPGPGCVHRLGWWVADAMALTFWARRLRRAGALPREVRPSFGACSAHRSSALRFTAPEGTEHELIGWCHGGDPPVEARGQSGIPAEHGLRGWAGARAYGRNRVASGDLLAGRLGLTAAGRDLYAVRGRRGLGEYAYDEAPARGATFGAGSVDAVAWSCAAPRQLRAWRQRVIGGGARFELAAATPWYTSIRFREPAGIAFEIATREPGFASAREPHDAVALSRAA